jgi:hypothetical protein
MIRDERCVAPHISTYIMLSELTNLKSYFSRTFVEAQSSDYSDYQFMFISVLFI